MSWPIADVDSTAWSLASFQNASDLVPRASEARSLQQKLKNRAKGPAMPAFRILIGSLLDITILCCCAWLCSRELATKLLDDVALKEPKWPVRQVHVRNRHIIGNFI